MIGALCFGTVFGFPFIMWGIFLIVDRDRTWQKQLIKSKAKTPVKRTSGWDTRQIILGSILIAFGVAVLVILATLNLAAQAISPPPPL